jgi:hypothetical protein
MFSQNLSNIFNHFNFEMPRESGMEEKQHFKEGLTIIRVFIYIVKEETFKNTIGGKTHDQGDKAGRTHNPDGENSNGSPDSLFDLSDLAGGKLTLVRNLVNLFVMPCHNFGRVFSAGTK